MTPEEQINSTTGTVSDKLLSAQALNDEKSWDYILIIGSSPDPDGNGAGGDVWLLSSTMPDFVRAGLLRWGVAVIDAALLRGSVDE